MGGLLDKLQRRRGAQKGVVVGKEEDQRSGTRNRKRAQTSILLTSRDPSPEGLLAELIGLRSGNGRGTERVAVAAQGALSDTPEWLSVETQLSPQLAPLITAARLVLYELFDEEASAKDLISVIKRAVNVASQRLAPEQYFTARDVQEAVRELTGLIAGKGPLQPLFDDALVTDIFLDAFDKIRCIRRGQAIETPFMFRNAREYEAFCSSMLSSAGKVLSTRCPVIGCVLNDSWRSRVHAVHGSQRENGQSGYAIRVPRLSSASLYDLLRSQTLPAPAAAWLSELVSFGERNILVIGPSGAGKTTFMSGLLSCVGSDERVCAIEEVPEIFVSNFILERFLIHPAESSPDAALSPERLVQAALDRSPHRIVFGDLRGDSCAAFLNALEAGQSGSLATMSAEDGYTALWRLLTLAATTGPIPVDSVRRRIARAVHMVIVMGLVDGRPCVLEISEVLPNNEHDFKLQSLIRYEGQAKGKRVWRKMVESSPILREMAEQGVELLTAPTLLAFEPVGDKNSEVGR